MKGVLLAAGEGTRLRRVTGGGSKVLLEIAGEPLLTHGLRALAALGAEEFVLVVGHAAESIAGRYGGTFEGVPIVYAHQREQKGLAHALLAAAPSIDGPFAAMHGDNFFAEGAAALRPVVERRRRERLAASLLVERVPPDRAVRGVCVADRRGEVRRVVEHPTSEDRQAGLVVAGFYAFAPSIFRACRAIEPSSRGEYELPDAITWLVRNGFRVAATPLGGRRVNVNTPGDLERARRIGPR